MDTHWCQGWFVQPLYRVYEDQASSNAVVPLTMGSIAAWFHSMIGNVLAGSWFAVLQSLGATCAGFFTILTKMAGLVFGFEIFVLPLISAIFWPF
ncbi:hypothetical protein B0T13DRAFT_462044 [Neurospora crassa]|nr:hypothetical protein B0T13DRAFT_462044 [Neurospora crassa]